MTRSRILLFLAAAALASAGAAWAAALAISPQKLTAFSYCIVRAANADTAVRQDAPTTNYGTVTEVHVRSAATNRRALVKFDLNSCFAPTTAVVTTATLSLYMTSAPTASRTYEARRVTASWIESGAGSATWNLQPSVGSVTSTTTTGTTSNVRRTWTVTADAQAWLSNPATNFGLRISDATEGSATSREARFAAKEWATAGQRPQLTIMYYPQ